MPLGETLMEYLYFLLAYFWQMIIIADFRCKVEERCLFSVHFPRGQWQMAIVLQS